MVKYGGGGFLVFLKPLTKGSRGLSYIFLITLHPSTFITIDYTTLLQHWVFVFWIHKEVFDGGASLEVDLHTKVIAFSFDTLTKSFIVRNGYIWSWSVVLLSVLFLFVCWIIHFYLDSIQSPSWIVTIAQCSVYMFFFLLQAILVGTYGLSSVEESSNNTIFGRNGLMAVPLKVLVRVGWLPVYRCFKPAFFIWADQNVQER